MNPFSNVSVSGAVGENSEQLRLIRRPFSNVKNSGAVGSKSSAALQCVLDVAGLTPLVAYGFRRLRAGYTGPACRVRNQENEELDIEFIGEDLDTATMVDFGGADGYFLVTLYDQMPGALHLSQPTAASQPYLGGEGEFTTLGTNSRPCIVFNGSSQFITRAATSLATKFVNTVVGGMTFGGTTRAIFDHNNNVSGTRCYLRFGSLPTYPTFSRGSSVSGTTSSKATQVLSATTTNGANSQIWRSGASIGTGGAIADASTNGTFHMGASPLGGSYFNGQLAEFMIFGTNLTTGERQAVEQNQGAYYGITVA